METKISRANVKKFTDNCKRDEVKAVLFQFVDIHGKPKSKRIPVEALPQACETWPGFAGGSVWGSGQSQCDPDMCARPDISSYIPLLWEPDLGRVTTNLFVDGQPYGCCPRTNLQRVLRVYGDNQYDFMVGMEPELTLLEVQSSGNGRRKLWDPTGVDTDDKPGYGQEVLEIYESFMGEMQRCLNDPRVNFGIYQSDHEDGPGQIECNFRFDNAVTTSDRITHYRCAARKNGLKKLGAFASFQPKPFRYKTGSGCHAHFSVWSRRTGKNLFLDAKDRQLGLSKFAYYFLGGIKLHAPALRAVLNPTPQCYNRLNIHQAFSSNSGWCWTPSGHFTLGGNNRSCMIRTPEPGHCEDRSFSSACNPYLALAAYWVAGMDGVEKHATAPVPIEGDAFQVKQTGKLLPQSLEQALDALEEDRVVQNALGPITNQFIKHKRVEAAGWGDYCRGEHVPELSYFDSL